MNFTLDYCLKILQEEYKKNAKDFKLCLDKYGKNAIITTTLRKNIIGGVNKYLTLKDYIKKHDSYESILLRIYNARVAMNEPEVVKQLWNIDKLFKEQNLN